MKTILHKSEDRGSVNFGWLESRHSFSFGHYYDPAKIHFGKLRVLNDDIVDGGAGFPTHPHDNMEIISIPLSGALAHRDSTGTEKAIQTGEVQIMSAGSGLTHSEYNFSKDEKVNFLQIWVMPKEKDITPRYDQKHFDASDRKNQLQTVVAPDQETALWINQDSWFSLADLDEGHSVNYDLRGKGNGIYVFNIEGETNIEGNVLKRRDAIGLSDTNGIELKAVANSKVLIIEVPMN
ncbi:MAG: pirin family protein [Cyclobacteriaceae bacterium]